MTGSVLLLISLFCFQYWREQTIRVETETAEVECRKAGVYELDTNRTEMVGYNASLYHDLLLSLNKNNTFVFNQNVPFLPGTKGRWEYVFGNDIAWFEFHFTDADLPEHNTLQFESGPKPNSLTISQPFPKYEQVQARLLYFVKK